MSRVHRSSRHAGRQRRHDTRVRGGSKSEMLEPVHREPTGNRSSAQRHLANGGT
jgi:hypothetical protein